MLKNSSQTTEFLESRDNVDEIIKDSLALELQKMRDRKPGRNDVKFRLLQQFVYFKLLTSKGKALSLL